MSSSTSHKIKSRTTGNDVFITPRKLAKLHIDMIPEEYFGWYGGLWLDPCKNDGSYYDQFTNHGKREYCEILEDKDFFKCESGPQVIIGNPPYSILDAWLKHTITLNPDCFSYLIGQGALTTRRMEWIEKAGYTITRLHLTKVWKWYGMSYIIVCEKGIDPPQKITMDRTVWREDPKPEPEPKALNISLKITIEPKPEICCDSCDYKMSQSDFDQGRGRLMFSDAGIIKDLYRCGCCDDRCSDPDGVIPDEEEQKCWTCGDTDVKHKTYRDALDEYELTCDKCHRIEYPEEYEGTDDDRCPTCGEWYSDCVSCECPNDCKCLKLCEEENGGRCPALSYDCE